jgi:hypothetical protein
VCQNIGFLGSAECEPHTQPNQLNLFSLLVVLFVGFKTFHVLKRFYSGRKDQTENKSDIKSREKETNAKYCERSKAPEKFLQGSFV